MPGIGCAFGFAAQHTAKRKPKTVQCVPGGGAGNGNSNLPKYSCGRASSGLFCLMQIKPVG
jgi:hypothetical protein